MVQNKTKTVFVIALGYVLCAAAAASYSWYYIQTLGGELEATVETVSKTVSQKQAYDDLVAQLEATQTQRDELQTFVLDKDATVQFLTLLETIAAEQSVELTTDNLNLVEVAAAPYNQLQIQFNVTGLDDGVLQFVRLLELLPYHSSLASLSFNRAATERSDNFLMRANGTLFISIAKP